MSQNDPNLPISMSQQREGQGDTALANRTKVPRKYKVLLLNDDFTPMDFVVQVLQKFFNKSQDQATEIMLQVHQQGVGVAGVFTLEIAEMKAMQCNQFARLNKHPLRTTVEPE
jgi:ATP-dependent Clp protease adaptor protein ClpS